MAAMEFYWTTADGVNIFAKDWSIEQPKAVIALVHGMGEHCLRYEHVASFFNEQGYAMVGYDRRGHGQSGGKKGHSPNIDVLLDEIDDLLKQCKQRYANLPILFYGHSMGGCLVVLHAIKRNPNVKAIFCSAPWIQLGAPPNGATKAVAGLINRFAPSVTLPTGLNAKFISKDPKEVKMYADDPLVHGKISIALALGMVDASHEVDTLSGDFKYPLYILHGGDDQITVPAASEALAKRLSGDIKMEILPDRYHEIHNEYKREEVFDKVLTWMNSKL
jgi:alpha-beta hydrolase superfamily lysophospholipase